MVGNALDVLKVDSGPHNVLNSDILLCLQASTLHREVDLKIALLSGTRSAVYVEIISINLIRKGMLPVM